MVHYISDHQSAEMKEGWCLGMSSPNGNNGTEQQKQTRKYFLLRHSSCLKVNKTRPSDKWPEFNRFPWQPGAICLVLSLLVPPVLFCFRLSVL